MSDGCNSCCGCAKIVQAAQNLDELDFMRGIWYAAQTGDLERVKELVKSGKYPVDSKDSAGYTALHYAVRNGHFEVCKYLVERGADVNAKTKAGGATPLHRACTAGKGENEIAEYLLDKKADVLLQDNDGKTPLHRAFAGKLKEFAKKVVLNDPQLKKIAEERGINLDFII